MDGLREVLVNKLGASATTRAEGFAFFTARGVAEVVRNLIVTTEQALGAPAPPLSKAKLFRQRRFLAERLGGDLGHSFTLTGLHEEQESKDDIS